MKAIDISTFNQVDWKKISGIDAVIIRAGFRQTKDNMFESHIIGARKAGLHIGIYWFGYAYTDEQAKAEAEFCIKTIEPYKDVIDLPVFYDWEYDSMRYAKEHGAKPTKSKITKWNKIFCEELKRAGYKVGVYYNLDYKKNYLDLAKLPYYKWLAWYSSEEDKTADIQQYTDKGTVAGIKGNVDMDKIYTQFWEDEKMAIVEYRGNLTKHFSLAEYTVGNAPSITLEINKRVMDFANLLEKFRVWLRRPMTVTSWKRSPALNKSVGGVPNSNHLYGTACDWHTTVKIDTARFIKYAKKWKKICEKAGFVGEAGLYNWGIHFGIQTDEQIKLNKGKFFHWDSRSGVQKNNPFKI